MKYSIRMCIFLPVLLILIMFPIGTFCIFRLTSDWYVSYTAENNVAHMTEHIRQDAEQIWEPDGSLTPPGEEEILAKTKQLMAKAREHLRQTPSKTQLIVFNSHYKEVYPSGPRNETSENEMSQRWKELLSNDQLPRQQPAFLEIGNTGYVAQLYEIPWDYSSKTKYFIIYEPLSDVSRMLSQTTGLMAAITTILLALSAVVVWIISKRIVKPVSELCRQAAKIGTCSTALDQASYSICELEQLRIAFVTMEKRLEELEHEKAAIFQNISHDLKTPLASIIGYADGIQRGIMTDTQKAAEIIMKESRRMNRMTDGILTLSKLDTHSWQLHNVRLPLEDFLEEQLEILQGITGQKTLVFSNEKCPASIQENMVETDPELLTRVFQNVISNCLRYAQSNVSVQLSCQGRFSVISVEDDGPGVHLEDLPHIFERNYRGRHGQFGIGLSIVGAGMEYLGGKAEIINKNPPCHGAVYYLYLPLWENNAAP